MTTMRRGQALIVVLLALAVALTVGLSIISRTVTEVGVSTTQEESARALSAAESGIEAALSSGVASGGNVGSQGSTYQVSSSPVGGGRYVAFPGGLMAGEVVTLYLAPYQSDGSPVAVPPTTFFPTNQRLDICWGDPTLGENPALVADLYYYAPSAVPPGYRISRLAYDPTPSHNNGFDSASISSPPTDADNCPSGINYKYSVRWNSLIGPTGFSVADAGPRPMFLRLRLWYNPTQAHYVGAGTVNGSTDIPVQGTELVSTGRSGETVRKVKVFQQYPDMPDFADFSILSGSDITKSN